MLKLEKEVEVKVTFPEEYHAEELKGKDAVFKCTIHEIKEKQIPEIDDEFAAEVSEFDTLDEYKADVKAKIKEQKENRRQAEEGRSGCREGCSQRYNGDSGSNDRRRRFVRWLDEFAQR